MREQTLAQYLCVCTDLFVLPPFRLHTFCTLLLPSRSRSPGRVADQEHWVPSPAALGLFLVTIPRKGSRCCLSHHSSPAVVSYPVSYPVSSALPLPVLGEGQFCDPGKAPRQGVSRAGAPGTRWACRRAGEEWGSLPPAPRSALPCSRVAEPQSGHSSARCSRWHPVQGGGGGGTSTPCQATGIQSIPGSQGGSPARMWGSHTDWSSRGFQKLPSSSWEGVPYTVVMALCSSPVSSNHFQSRSRAAQAV